MCYHHQNQIHRRHSSRKETGNHLVLFFPRCDLDFAVVSKDNSINKAISQGLAELCLAGNGVRHSRLSSSEILTTRIRRKKFHLKIACSNVRTLLQKEKMENIKHKIAW